MYPTNPKDKYLGTMLQSRPSQPIQGPYATQTQSRPTPPIRGPYDVPSQSPSAVSPIKPAASNPKQAFVQSAVQSAPTPQVQAQPQMQTGNFTTPSGAVVNSASGSMISGPPIQQRDTSRDRYSAAFDSYIQSLMPTEAENQASIYLRSLIDTSKREEEKALNMGETLGFARGEAERTNRNRALDIEAATNAYNALTGNRNAMTEAQKARVEFEKSMLPEEKKRSTAYTEYQDAVDSGFTGSFTDYQNEDANRKARAAGSSLSKAPTVIGSSDNGYLQFDPVTNTFIPLKVGPGASDAPDASQPSFEQYIAEAEKQLGMNIYPESETYAELRQQYEGSVKKAAPTQIKGTGGKGSIESRIDSLL